MQISRTSVALDPGIEPVTFTVIAWLPLAMLTVAWATPSIVKYQLTILLLPRPASLIVAVTEPTVLSATGRAWVFETTGFWVSPLAMVSVPVPLLLAKLLPENSARIVYVPAGVPPGTL